MSSRSPRQSVGVTVGVGDVHERLARLSSACFTRHTGVPTVILGPQEMQESGETHPAALRLWLFKYVRATRVVYFDADWFCLQKWDLPNCSDAHELMACRDFILKDEWPKQRYDFNSREFTVAPSGCSPIGDELIRADYVREVSVFANLRRPCWGWINTGLMVMDRTHHEPLLQRARTLYHGVVGHHDTYYEQPAIAKALEELGTPVRLLARCFNVLAASEAVWPAAVVGLHVKVKRHDDFIAAVRDGTIDTPEAVRKYFCLPRGEH